DFFFSSRRRHTRFSRDWSSDVCSSDLDARFDPRPGYYGTLGDGTLIANCTTIIDAAVGEAARLDGALCIEDVTIRSAANESTVRSEERRVGNERVSRGATDQ